MAYHAYGPISKSNISRSQPVCLIFCQIIDNKLI
jgi:hypothetical protein